MLKLTAEITGQNFADLEEGLREIKKAVENKYTSGSDGNDNRDYRFDISKEKKET